MAFLVVPTLIVVPMSFSDSQYLEFPPREWSLRWYRNYFTSAAWMQATATSLKAAFLTVLVATPLGTLAAYGLCGVALPAARAAARAADHADDRAGDPGRHRRVLRLRAAEAQQLARRPGAGAQLLAVPLVMIIVAAALQELRHEPGDGGAQPRRLAPARLPLGDAAADPLRGRLRGAAVVPDLVRRGDPGAVRLRRRATRP